MSLTIRDAARATGLTIKALRRRVERGTLAASVVDGTRRIPVAELERAGLLVHSGQDGAGRRGGPSNEVVTALLRRIAGLEQRLATVERTLKDHLDDADNPRA